MRALIVFESMFGNTAAIARAVGEGLAGSGEVAVVPVGEAPTTVGPDIDLLVVGGPTHAFGLSHASTRANAVRKGANPVTGIEVGLREWLDQVVVDSTTTSVATFDTRVLRAHVPGSAARAALRRLRQDGLSPAASPISFDVADTPGPLGDDELDRARAWGERLAAHAAVESRPSPDRTPDAAGTAPAPD